MKNFKISITVSENWIIDGFSLTDGRVNNLDDLVRELTHLNEYARTNEVTVETKDGNHFCPKAEREMFGVDDKGVPV